jgi:hypothetical protein
MIGDRFPSVTSSSELTRILRWQWQQASMPASIDSGRSLADSRPGNLAEVLWAWLQENGAFAEAAFA